MSLSRGPEVEGRRLLRRRHTTRRAPATAHIIHHCLAVYLCYRPLCYVTVLKLAMSLLPDVPKQVILVPAQASLLGPCSSSNRRSMTPSTKLLVLLYAETTS